MEAEFVLGACERFGCLPSQLVKEDVALMRLLAIEAAGKQDERDEPVNRRERAAELSPVDGIEMLSINETLVPV